jgi:hypothetical protein
MADDVFQVNQVQKLLWISSLTLGRMGFVPKPGMKLIVGERE